MRRFYQQAILLAACIGWTACANDMVQGEYPLDKVYSLTVDAQRGGQRTMTRGLTDDLQAVWRDGDEVTVLNDKSIIGTMTPQTFGSPSKIGRA